MTSPWRRWIETPLSIWAAAIAGRGVSEALPGVSPVLERATLFNWRVKPATFRLKLPALPVSPLERRASPLTLIVELFQAA